jgi:branched-chain amino acid transport system ATP-binding protein
MLKLNNIEVIYLNVILVLKGVSLEVPDGKIVSLLDGNGAGKTTNWKPSPANHAVSILNLK